MRVRDAQLRWTGTAFELTSDDGLRRTFSDVSPGSGEWKLTFVEDRYHNAIRLRYDTKGAWVEAIDAVGRTIRVERDAHQRILSFVVLTQPNYRNFTYSYDARGRLVGATNAEGMCWKYEYEERDLLVQERTPLGRETHFRYDADGRCRETWVMRPGNLGLDREVPRVLADGSPARGFLHAKVERVDGYVEVVNSRDAKRYFFDESGALTRSVFAGGAHESQFDEVGQIVSYVAPGGARFLWLRDELGRVILEEGPTGARRHYVRDAAGCVTAYTDALGRTVRFDRNTQGDVLLAGDDEGPLLQKEYESRGLVTRVTLPDGASTRMEYDDHGNRVVVTEPSGASRRVRYDQLGQVLSFLDEHGRETRFLYDGCCRLLRIAYADGTACHYGYDRDGNLASVTNQLGQQYVLVWGALNQVCEVRRPDGTVASLRYDLESDLVRVENSTGEEHVITRSPAGRIVEEHTFDGRRISLRTNQRGELSNIRSAGAKTSLERDDAGRIIRREFADGVEHSFEYDAAGRLIVAKTQEVVCRYLYDSRGNLVEESQTFRGDTAVVRKRFDQRGQYTRMETSEGHVRDIRFDSMGLPVEIALDGDDPLRFSYDPTGLEIERTLPGGAGIRLSRDLLGRVSAKDGRRADGSIFLEQRFTRLPTGYASQIFDKDWGVTQLSYDPVGALLERSPDQGSIESFQRQGFASCDDGRKVRLSPGGRVDAHDGAEFTYDRWNRLIERREGVGKAQQVTRYAWNASGTLRSLVRPDGVRVDYVYDCFSRRIAKSVSRGRKVTLRARYVWSQDDLVHEIIREANSAGDPITEVRTYVDKPGSTDLVAEVRSRTERSDGGSPESEVLFPITDSRWCPERMVDRTGRVVEELKLGAYGGGAASANVTHARFAGHWFDPESGLHYNRHRYYDPRTGHYLSPEPLGLIGGLSPFGYADRSPYEVIDTDGQLGMNATASGGGIRRTRGSASTEGIPSSEVNLHPVVTRALTTTSHHNVPFSSDPRSPAACAEPRAVSDYLNEYERRNGVRLDDSEEGRAHTTRALSEMRVGARQDDDGRPRAPCRNCSQFFANLMEQHGAPSPNNIAPGFLSANGSNDRSRMTNFTPPRAGRPGHTAYPISAE